MKRLLLTVLTTIATILSAVANAPVLAFSESMITLAPGESKEVHIVLVSLDESMNGFQIQFTMCDANHHRIDGPVRLDSCYTIDDDGTALFHAENISSSEFSPGNRIGNANGLTPEPGIGDYRFAGYGGYANNFTYWNSSDVTEPVNVFAFTIKVDEDWNEEMATFELDLDWTMFVNWSNTYHLSDPLVLTIRNSNFGLPTTEPPVISYSITDEAVNVTATGAGEVKLYKDGVEVENPCTLARTSVDQTFTFSATAKEEGKLISETTTLQVDVPAKEVEPGEVYKPENVTVVPSTTTADVSWMDIHNNGWNLRFREVLPGIDSNLLWDFEEDTNGNSDKSLPGGWTCIDADGDGYEWFHLNDTPDLDYANHSGIGHVTSASYVHTTDSTGRALTPDNWLVSPRVKIDGELSFWACGQDPNWASEVFRVYTSTDKVNWVPISDDITATGEMTEYTFDLTPYACQNGYVAIRHYNVTDMFRLNVDDIAITYVKPADWIYVNGLYNPYYTINGLTPGTNYEVQVQGLNNNEETSDWTESIVFTTSVLLGDVNYDCMVNIADLNEMLNIIFYDGAFVVAADMNTDLIINVQDVVGLVHFLLNGEIPSISSNGRRAPKAETAGQASLYWQDGVLYLNTDVPVSALNIINDVDGDITWSLDDYGMVVMQETGTSGEHSVIFSFDRNVIPPGVTAIATTNSQTPSVVGAELSTLDSKLIPVTLNDQITGLTNIQAAGEINCYMDGSSLVIDNNAIMRDLDIAAYTIDGRAVANQHLSHLDSGQTSIEMNDIIKSNRYLIIVIRNGRQILATLKLTQNR